MIFHAFQREDDDSVFTVVRNIRGSALAVGDAVAWSTSTPDGVRVSVPASGALALFRGIVAEAIDNSAYGKVQVHGYCASAKITNATTTVVAGTPFLPTASNVYLTPTTQSLGDSGFVYSAETVASATTPAATTAKVFIRAL
jgi:hypothetical protein